MRLAANKYYEIDRERVPSTAPAGTRTHVPVAHEYVLSHVENAIYASGNRVLGGRYFLSHGEDRFIAQLDVLNEKAYEQASNHQGWSSRDGMTIAIINSHDKSYAARICGGAIIGKGAAYLHQETVARKHTTFIERDYPGKVASATQRIIAMKADINARIDCYLSYEFLGADYREANRKIAKIALVHDAVIQLMKCGAIAPSGIPEVLGNFKVISESWNKLNRNSGGDLIFTAYQLFEAVSVYQNSEKNPFTLPERSQALFGVMDNITGAEKAICDRVLDVIGK